MASSSGDIAFATMSRLLLTLARLDAAPETYRRLVDAVPLVGRDALRHVELMKFAPRWACWASRLQYLYTRHMRHAKSTNYDETSDVVRWSYSGDVTRWTIYRRQHRENDLPAYVDGDGGYHWYRYGVPHRDNNQPASVCADGSKLWCHNGKLHRDDGGVTLESNGMKYWHRNGKLHRDNDLPAIVFPNGTKQWFRDGKLHRDGDLPAVERLDGTNEWYRDGKKVSHPAVVDPDSRPWTTVASTRRHQQRRRRRR